ncbi:hypothetical protein [Stenotrophomonas forensis]|uniref:Uncharacterized protein n=1 Tax=Stenotrophomonas forensis TaxID=2871169 RepID=A0ABY7Y4F6_9GAMM|nr:hypothetical protein [Stenotrophomonas sp. DFS-20110405]WDM64838.1 hypothetical protein K5L94_05995 [Stenotrophomonas sp. DFS-20110405]
MSIEQLFSEYRVLFVLLYSLAFVNALLAHRALYELKVHAPELLRGVGIDRIDWWFGCIRGVLRLGFGKAGRDLPWFSRTLFKGVGFHYAWLSALMLLVVLGILKIGS